MSWTDEHRGRHRRLAGRRCSAATVLRAMAGTDALSVAGDGIGAVVDAGCRSSLSRTEDGGYRFENRLGYWIARPAAR